MFSSKKEIIVDSKKIKGNIIPIFYDRKVHKVKIFINF